MDAICAFLLGSMIAVILISAIKYWTDTTKYCNSEYNLSDTDVNLDIPRYNVVSIKKTMTKNSAYRWIAKYTLRNLYITGKNRASEQTLILYDEIGKYNIGDKLTFTKIN